MGGSRDYNQKERWRKAKKKPIEDKEEEKKAPPKKEDVDDLMNLWLKKKNSDSKEK